MAKQRTDDKSKPFQGSRLRTLREDEDWTLDDVGTRLNPTMTRQHLSKIELGEYQPSAATVNQFADLFNTTTDYLFGRTDRRGKPDLSPHEALVLETLRRKDYPELFRLLGGEQKQNADQQAANGARRAQSENDSRALP